MGVVAITDHRVKYNTADDYLEVNTGAAKQRGTSDPCITLPAHMQRRIPLSDSTLTYSEDRPWSSDGRRIPSSPLIHPVVTWAPTKIFPPITLAV